MESQFAEEHIPLFNCSIENGLIEKSFSKINLNKSIEYGILTSLDKLVICTFKQNEIKIFKRR